MIKRLKYYGKGKSSEHLAGSKGISNINIGKVIGGSLTKLNPYYLAKDNAVMFTVEVGFLIVLAIALTLPTIPKEFASQTRIFYYEISVILIITVWFATFSEALSEAQAKARVDSLRSLEREVTARKIKGDKREVIVNSRTLKPGDEVLVYSGEVIPRDGLVIEGKAFVDDDWRIECCLQREG
jgi:potassium-transporting ATPase ATP-binding subunit